MTPRVWVVSGLLLAATATAVLATTVLADGSKASIGVSAQVVRSCRVTTDQPQVSVDCGTRPQPIQVSRSGAATVSRTVTGRTEVAPATVSSVTIHF